MTTKEMEKAILPSTFGKLVLKLWLEDYSVMNNRHFAIIAVGLSIALGGCSSQSKTALKPVWVSSNINGLQASPCNCGGVLPEKTLKAQKKAIEAQEKARRKAEKDGI